MEVNIHSLLDGLDSREFPGLTYTRDLEDWHDFIRRTPKEYAAWIDGVSKECEILELEIRRIERLYKNSKGENANE